MILTFELQHQSLLQVSLHPGLDDVPLLESIDQLLMVCIDPSDLCTCAFSKYYKL